MRFMQNYFTWWSESFAQKIVVSYEINCHFNAGIYTPAIC